MKFVTLLLFSILTAMSASAADARKKLVMLIAEPEYDTAKTLPEFAAAQLAQDFQVVTVTGSTAAGENTFDHIEEIANADVRGDHFNIDNAGSTLARRSVDPWADYEGSRQTISATMRRALDA